MFDLINFYPESSGLIFSSYLHLGHHFFNTVVAITKSKLARFECCDKVKDSTKLRTIDLSAGFFRLTQNHNKSYQRLVRLDVANGKSQRWFELRIVIRHHQQLMPIPTKAKLWGKTLSVHIDLGDHNISSLYLLITIVAVHLLKERIAILLAIFIKT